MVALQRVPALLALASPPAQLLAQQSAGGSAFKAAALRSAVFAEGGHGCVNM